MQRRYPGSMYKRLKGRASLSLQSTIKRRAYFVVAATPALHSILHPHLFISLSLFLIPPPSLSLSLTPFFPSFSISLQTFIVSRPFFPYPPIYDNRIRTSSRVVDRALLPLDIPRYVFSLTYATALRHVPGMEKIRKERQEDSLIFYIPIRFRGFFKNKNSLRKSFTHFSTQRYKYL